MSNERRPSSSEDHPFKSVFESKRRHDAARLKVMRDLAGWTQGNGSVEQVEARLARLQEALDDLRHQVTLHRNVVIHEAEHPGIVHRSAYDVNTMPKVVILNHLPDSNVDRVSAS